MGRPSDDELDRFYEQANKLDYNAWNFRLHNEQRMERARREKWSSKKWYMAQRQASRRFVLRIIRMVENFE